MGHKAGYLYFLLSNIIGCAGSLCIQQITRLPNFQLVYFRGIFSFIINWMICKSQKIDVYVNSPTTTLKLFLRGLNSFSGFGLWVYGLHNMSLSEATTLFQTGPMWTTFFAMYYLKEKMEFLQGVTIVLCLLGAILVLKPPFIFPSAQIEEDGEKNRFLGGICCLSTAILSGSAFNLVRELRNHCHGQLTVHYMTVVMCIFTPLLVLYQGVVVPTFGEILYLVLMALCTTIGQTLLTRGLKFGSAGKSSIMGYSQILLTLMIDLILQRPPDTLSLIGALSISSCVVVLFIEKKK